MLSPLKYARLLWVTILFVVLLSGSGRAASATPPPDRYLDAVYLAESAANPVQSVVPYQQDLVQGDLALYDCAAFQFIPLNSWELGYIDRSTGRITLTDTGTRSEITPRLDRGCSRIAFAANYEGNYEIFIMRMADRSVARIKGAGDNVRPFWSPDGAQIVFESDRDYQGEIYLMNADGSNLRRLTNHSGYDGMPFYSPDGSHILFVSDRSGYARIYRMDLDGSNLTAVGSIPESYFPVYSPDGSKIGFSADSDGNGWLEVWVMDADGSDPQLLVNPGVGYDGLTSSWSANEIFLDYTHVRWIEYEGQWYWNFTMLQSYDFLNNQPTNWYLQWGNATEWYIARQTSDTIPPTSTLGSLPEVSSVSVPVAWSGYDTPADNFRGFDVQVKDGALPWTDWLVDTQQTSAVYQGAGGHTYGFRVRARDYSSNFEAWPAQAEAVTYMENRPPEITLARFPADAPGEFTAAWNAEEPYGDTVQSYDLQYRQSPAGDWTDWLVDTTLVEAQFQGIPGFIFDFRIRATDHGLSTSAWPAEPHGSVTMYAAMLFGNVYDHTGAPIDGTAASTGSPQPELFKFVASTGKYKAYYNAIPASQPFQLTKSGYGLLPLTDFPSAVEREVNFWLPPANNAIQDWGFEGGNLADWWAPSGAITPALTGNPAHTGALSARLGQPALPDLEPPELLSGQSGGDTAPVAITDYSGRVHLFFLIGNEFQYTIRGLDGVWSPPYAVQINTTWSPHPSAAIDDLGVIHLVFMRQDEDIAEIYYQALPPGGTWSSPVQISHTPDSSYSPHIAIDSRGFMHVIWRDVNLYGGVASIVYTNRSPAGVWSNPYFLGGQNDPVTLLIGRDDNVHILWYLDGSNLMYARFAAPELGNLEDYRILLDSSPDQGDYYSPPFWLDHMGLPHIAWLRATSGYPELCAKRLTEYEFWTEEECVPVGGEFAGSLWVALDSSGNEHYIWNALQFPGIWRLMYNQRGSDGIWDVPQSLLERTCSGCISLGLVSGESQTLYTWWTDSSNLYFLMKEASVSWTASQPVAPSGSTYEFIRRVAEYSGDLAMIYASQSQVYWIGQEPVQEGGASSISQAVDIPESMSHPALSFSYRLAGAYPDLDAGLAVAIQDNIKTTQVLTLTTNTSNWLRASVDVSAWAGEHITITLETTQVASAPRLRAYIDEVALGPVYPDMRVDFDEHSDVLRPGETVTLTVQVQNQGHAPASGVELVVDPPTGLNFTGASLPPASASGQVTFQLGNFPSSSPVTSIDLFFLVDDALPGGEIMISASLPGLAELEEGNDIAFLALTVDADHYIYLPRLMR